MASIPTIKELRSMQAKDLQSEIADQSLVLAKMKLDVENQSEKDTAKLRRLRKGIATMHTVLNEKRKASTVAAPSSPKNK